VDLQIRTAVTLLFRLEMVVAAKWRLAM